MLELIAATGGGLKFFSSDHIYAFIAHCKSSVGKRFKSSDIQSNIVYHSEIINVIIVPLTQLFLSHSDLSLSREYNSTG